MAATMAGDFVAQDADLIGPATVTRHPSKVPTAKEADWFDLRTFLASQSLVPPLAEWTSLSGGRSNLTWRVWDAATALVVKLFRPGVNNPLFPNDPVCEARVLTLLDGQSLAPRIRARVQTPLGVCILYDHVPGQSWTTDTAPVARLLARVHATAAPSGLRAACDGSADLAAGTARILGQCAPGATRDHLTALMPITDPIPPENRNCLLHGDPVPGNVITAQNGPILIDWQCPAIGDPVEDIALFLSPAMQILYRGAVLTSAERDGFLAAYGNPDITRRYLALSVWYHWRMAAYCLWRGADREPLETRAMEAELTAMRA